MSFIYNRVCDLRRPRVHGAVEANMLPPEGRVPGYSGTNQGEDRGETPIQSGIPCSIQYAGQARGMGAELPADTANRTNWDFFFPRLASPRGLVKKGDILVDDEDGRYEVVAPNWGPLGYRIRTEKMEA